MNINMTKKSFFTLFSAFAIVTLLNSCNNSDDNTGKANDSAAVKKADTVAVNKTPEATKENAVEPSKGIKLVCVDAGMDTAMSMPRTDVMLSVDGNMTKLQTISGEGQVYNKELYKSMGIPADALSACGAWWAGGGDYFYVVARDGKPVVYQGWQDEGQKKSGYNWEVMKPKKK